MSTSLYMAISLATSVVNAAGLVVGENGWWALFSWRVRTLVVLALILDGIIWPISVPVDVYRRARDAGAAVWANAAAKSARAR